MNVITAWVQTPYFDPSNPNQQPIERMVQQGGDRGYATFYWNQVPTDVKLYASNNGGFAGATPRTRLAIGLSIGVVVLAGGLAYGLLAHDHHYRRRG